MPPKRRSGALRVGDMLEAIAKIQRYTRGMTADAFAADERTIDAIVRNLEILGEAATRLSQEDQNLCPQLPWHEMRGLRNKVTHEYFGIDPDIIWQTITGDLPPLVQPLRQLLAALDKV